MLGIGGEGGFLFVVLHRIWCGVDDLVRGDEMGLELVCKVGREIPTPVPHTQVIFKQVRRNELMIDQWIVGSLRQHLLLIYQQERQ
jgi:hypothetical protein